MKTKLILSAICIVSLSSLFVACSDDDNDTTKPVIVINEPEDEGATVAAENASKVDPRKMVYQRDHRQPEVERAAGGPVYSRHHAEPQPRQEASPPRADAPRYTRFARAKGPDTGPKRKRDD